MVIRKNKIVPSMNIREDVRNTHLMFQNKYDDILSGLKTSDQSTMLPVVIYQSKQQIKNYSARPNFIPSPQDKTNYIK